VYVSKHHTVYLECIQFLFISYVSVNLGEGVEEERELERERRRPQMRASYPRQEGGQALPLHPPGVLVRHLTKVLSQPSPVAACLPATCLFLLKVEPWVKKQEAQGVSAGRETESGPSVHSPVTM
jgi:hypothetical protein